ncbi:hypothetical protein FKP32DRAFT_819564 [Trametes sanguinea]|nr:hypothetical protein FKP32DRAFT_819564 [Trametes sanguinea]
MFHPAFRTASSTCNAPESDHATLDTPTTACQSFTRICLGTSLRRAPASSGSAENSTTFPWQFLRTLTPLQTCCDHSRCGHWCSRCGPWPFLKSCGRVRPGSSEVERSLGHSLQCRLSTTSRP